MKNFLRLIPMIAAAAVVSCTGPREPQSPSDALISRLAKQIEDGKIMFGHQDTYLYGHSWKIADDAVDFSRTDIKDAAGVYPSLYGMDLGGIELDSPLNIDNNRFDLMRASAVAQHERGGVVTFSWHPRNPLTGGDTWDTASTEVVASILPGGEKHELFMSWLSKAADFLESIKTADGKTVPVIFRPWHEHTKNWFWWGQDLCTTEQYKALWQMTYDYMNNERGLDHLVWSYSPDAGGNNELDVVERYPGDEIVDMIGIDFYQFGSGEQYVERMKYALDIISAFAQERGKMIAVTEAGYEGVKNPKWWTEVLYPAIKDYPVSYVLLWRNACDDNMQHHFYVPFPGHESVEDFKVFTTLDKIMFL